ncbi:DUF378 domain-containing protein [Rummeliibacillus sp. G93]|uniref:Uncharacterized protein n=1 Tax=Rummeliibacillus stabekisii TaxID=241244 RepID=A0A143HDC7_9BACL|nr:MULTISPECIES: DUF378 domain-containing protein [Rummeliibacillus]AMW99692.1 hypothetical protein ATY39_09715 [Rummeliibacillus stabekisii]MBB5170906.1 hypothetical protein [Rummeliibacillus stabekisii]MCM3317086.1 DUF378 domain-containing protein [Rummeliibacillus stabekisii]UQW96583.1 DUF378 domain-containing protein [Rummeliibacillus sp. G93]GEL05439.1 hypothetical protein RST01_20660 [Rummeliibacillus stabekisii]
MSGLQKFALLVTVIGALNWGLIGIFQFDVVATLFGAGQQSFGARAIYTLVAIAGLISLSMFFVSERRNYRVVKKDNVRPIRNM